MSTKPKKEFPFVPPPPTLYIYTCIVFGGGVPHGAEVVPKRCSRLVIFWARQSAVCAGRRVRAILVAIAVERGECFSGKLRGVYKAIWNWVYVI